MSEIDGASPAPAERSPSRARGEGSLVAWGRALLRVRSVSPERRTAVLRDIEQGSQPTALYYVLLGLSELIAGFALIVDSDATLIGANVVAPLMTPIFGASLGLMRGDLRLLRRALLAELGGAALGAALCYVLGLMPFMGEPSAALLAQTRPTLIDLIVAALAGCAGGLAMIDERVSPALPGVAIATALNPPIAALGLCLACGAYAGAWGAFLLFFANFLAILAVGAVLFIGAGFVTRAEIGPVGSLARRFAAAAVGLLLVTALLTNYLVVMVRHLRTERAIHAVLDAALAQEPNTALVSVDFRSGGAGLDVLSVISTPRVIAPEMVKRIQDSLRERLGESVRLFMRCSVTADVSATGSTNVRPYLSLDGRVAEAPLAPDMRLLQQAEQVAREVAATRPDMQFDGIDLVHMPSGPVFILAITSSRAPTAEGVARFETALRSRLGEPTLQVVARRTESTDTTGKGRILLGEAHFGAGSGAELERRAAVEQAVRTSIAAVPDMFPAAVDAVRSDQGWRVRAEVFGPRLLTPAEVRAIEQRSAGAVGEEVAVSVWARTELRVTADHYAPLSE